MDRTAEGEYALWSRTLHNSAQSAALIAPLWSHTFTNNRERLTNSKAGRQPAEPTYKHNTPSLDQQPYTTHTSHYLHVLYSLRHHSPATYADWVMAVPYMLETKSSEKPSISASR